jgi:hypothetical protein
MGSIGQSQNKESDTVHGKAISEGVAGALARFRARAGSAGSGPTAPGDLTAS